MSKAIFITGVPGVGKTEKIQDQVLSWKDWWENDIKEQGAIEINASEKVENTIQQILSLTT